MRKTIPAAISLLLSIYLYSGCDRASDTNIQEHSPIKTISSIAIQADTPDVLLAGETIQFSAKGQYTDGSEKDMTAGVMWLISDAKNVSMSKTGFLKVIGGGPPPGAAAPGTDNAAPEKTSVDGLGSLEVNPYDDTLSLDAAIPDEKSQEVYVMASLAGIKSQVVPVIINTASGPSEYLLSGGKEGISARDITLPDANRSAVKVADQGVLTFSNSVITTSGDSFSAVNSAVFGLNAAVLSKSGGRINLSNITITTSGNGATGVFSTGKGTSINAQDIKIRTSGYGAHSVAATMGGLVTVRDVNISASGDHGAAVATGRGGGNITGAHVTTSTSSENGSPCIYIESDGVVSLSDANMTAAGSEGAVITGTGTLNLKDTDLTGAACGLKAWGMDQTRDEARVSVSGGSIAAVAGDAICVTGTRADILIEDRTAITFGDGCRLLTVTDSGSAAFTAKGLAIQGDISADAESILTISLKRSTTLTGTITNAALSIDPTSQWIVKGDSTLTTLDLDGIAKIRKSIRGNGHTIYYDADAGANSWLRGKTYDLEGGGALMPR